MLYAISCSIRNHAAAEARFILTFATPVFSTGKHYIIHVYTYTHSMYAS